MEISTMFFDIRVKSPERFSSGPDFTMLFLLRIGWYDRIVRIIWEPGWELGGAGPGTGIARRRPLTVLPPPPMPFLPPAPWRLPAGYTKPT